MDDPLVMPARLESGAAGSLLADLTARAGQNLTLDMRHVTFVGGLCLQVLVSAARKIRCDGGRMVLSDVSHELEAQLRLLGVSSKSLMEGHP